MSKVPTALTSSRRVAFIGRTRAHVGWCVRFQRRGAWSWRSPPASRLWAHSGHGPGHGPSAKQGGLLGLDQMVGGADARVGSGARRKPARAAEIWAGRPFLFIFENWTWASPLAALEPQSKHSSSPPCHNQNRCLTLVNFSNLYRWVNASLRLIRI